MSAKLIPYENELIPVPRRYILCDAPNDDQPVRCTRPARHTGQHQGWRADPNVAPEDMVPVVWERRG